MAGQRGGRRVRPGQLALHARPVGVLAAIRGRGGITVSVRPRPRATWWMAGWARSAAGSDGVPAGIAPQGVRPARQGPRSSPDRRARRRLADLGPGRHPVVPGGEPSAVSRYAGHVRTGLSGGWIRG